MTTVTLELPDQLVRVVEQKAQARGVSLSQHVSDLLEKSTESTSSSRRTEAIRRMNDLFEQVNGFQVEPNIPREELYERGSLR